MEPLLDLLHRYLLCLLVALGNIMEIREVLALSAGSIGMVTPARHTCVVQWGVSQVHVVKVQATKSNHCSHEYIHDV